VLGARGGPTALTRFPAPYSAEPDGTGLGIRLPNQLPPAGVGLQKDFMKAVDGPLGQGPVWAEFRKLPARIVARYIVMRRCFPVAPIWHVGEIKQIPRQVGERRLYELPDSVVPGTLRRSSLARDPASALSAHDCILRQTPRRKASSGEIVNESSSCLESSTEADRHAFPLLIYCTITIAGWSRMKCSHGGRPIHDRPVPKLMLRLVEHGGHARRLRWTRR
jgi:hypothetical protein